MASSSRHRNQTSVSRSFWRAGDYDVGSVKSAPPEGELEHARVHPKFLHSNATSHKWAFGAIAELLDNAVDEVNNGATFVKVDVINNMEDTGPALLFHDDGGGMDPDCMRQCMSLGYSSKKANTTIGQYGNGFKTSTMRLGADVIVFSRATRGSRVTQSIGLLSYTFLRKTGQDDVIVPMVDFEISGSQTRPLIYGSQDDWSSNLKLILEWSPFASNEELMKQFDDVGVRGTKVIIYNLWLNDDGLLELELNNDDEDICLREEIRTGKAKAYDRILESHISYKMRYSLRAYASILYLKKFTNFKIILRGKAVEQYIIAEELKYSKTITYKPKLGTTSKEVVVKTTIGFVKQAPALGVSGFNVYHKNRLIRPYWKVTSDGSSRGRSVVGILEANFIEPAHDKQDFERSALFIRLETKLKQIIIDYWSSNCHLIGVQSPVPEIRDMQRAAQNSSRLKAGLPKDMHSAFQETHVHQPVIGLAANIHPQLANAPSVVDLAPNSWKEKPSPIQPIIGLEAVSVREESLDVSGSTLIDQICEENIQLFMRCDAHRQKEIDLKSTIEELQKELEEAKRKCSELSSHMECRKKQMLANFETGKV